MLYRWRDGMGLLSTSTQQSMHLEISESDYWECTHFPDATRPRIPMHEKGKVSALRVLTRRTCLIQSWGGKCYQRDLLIIGTVNYVCPSILSERNHLVECGKARNISKEGEKNPPPLKSLPKQTRTWHCTCREPICKCGYGRQRTRLTFQMYN